MWMKMILGTKLAKDLTVKMSAGKSMFISSISWDACKVTKACSQYRVQLQCSLKLTLASHSASLPRVDMSTRSLVLKRGINQSLTPSSWPFARTCSGTSLLTSFKTRVTNTTMKKKILKASHVSNICRVGIHWVIMKVISWVLRAKTIKIRTTEAILSKDQSLTLNSSLTTEGGEVRRAKTISKTYQLNKTNIQSLRKIKSKMIKTKTHPNSY